MPFRKAEAITRKIRDCCGQLIALDGVLRQDAGITVAQWSVVESLYNGTSSTVPKIARLKRVSRQHIQVLVDRLVAAGIVATRSNPADRRSPLLTLTRHGATLFEQTREREIGILTDLARELRQCDVDATLTTLNALQDSLDKTLSRENRRT
jgi:DNA-binding MarR family transcriptional regulator